MQLVNDRVWNPDSKLCNLSSSSPVYSIKHLETHCGAVFGKITCVRLLSIDKKTHYNQELFSAWKLSSPLPPTGINNVVITLSNWRKQDPDCGYRGLCVCVCVCVTQLYPTLCDPMDCTHQASPSMEISQARILEWLPFPSPGDLPNPGINPVSPELAGRFFTTSTTWEAYQ